MVFCKKKDLDSIFLELDYLISLNNFICSKLLRLSINYTIIVNAKLWYKKFQSTNLNEINQSKIALIAFKIAFKIGRFRFKNCSIISSKKFRQTKLNKMSNRCVSTLFCMRNLKPNNLEFFVRLNSKCEIVDYPMIKLP